MSSIGIRLTTTLIAWGCSRKDRRRDRLCKTQLLLISVALLALLPLHIARQLTVMQMLSLCLCLAKQVSLGKLWEGICRSISLTSLDHRIGSIYTPQATCSRISQRSLFTLLGPLLGQVCFQISTLSTNRKFPKCPKSMLH